MNIPYFNSMLNARRSFKREPSSVLHSQNSAATYLSLTESSNRTSQNQRLNSISNKSTNNMNDGSSSGNAAQRSASIKRLPFSYIKTSTVQQNGRSASRSRESSSANIPQQVSPKLCDDNYFLYANNDPNNAENAHSSNKLSPNQNVNNKFKNNYNFTRATLKTSSFHNYGRYSRYLKIERSKIFIFSGPLNFMPCFKTINLHQIIHSHLQAALFFSLFHNIFNSLNRYDDNICSFVEAFEDAHKKLNDKTQKFLNNVSLIRIIFLFTSKWSEYGVIFMNSLN